MTEIKSPAQIEVDNRPYNRGYRDGWELAHEPAICGHARANYKDPKFGTPEYRGQERCEFCDAIAAIHPHRPDAGNPEEEEPMNCIGWAVKQMWNGDKVQRTGWNGKGMWLALQVPDEHSKMGHPYVYLHAADGKLIPWNCSQADLLATDWETI